MKRVINIFVFALSITVLIFTTAAPVYSSSSDHVRVWVQYAPGKKGPIRGALQAAGAQFHYDFDRLESFVVTLPEAALAGIRNNPNVVDIEEDVPRYIFDQTVPYGIDSVQARDVWDADRDGVIDDGAPTGAGRIVCIIDTGLYTDHEDFAGVDIIGGYSQVDADSSRWSNDGYGHGTHVAGTIVAANNSLGVVGVTPGTVSLYIIKIFNDNGDWTLASDLVDAIYRCDDAGANIISMSLGGSRLNGRERRAFNDLYNQGILHVAAAGNAGDTSYSYPASYDSVISVAAVDENNVVADFSQKNDQVELAAPGVKVLSTVPWIAIDTLTVDGVTYDGNHIENSAYGTASGELVDGELCDSTGSWSGKVVLCERGLITFFDKVMNVENSGGAAAVIYNNEPGNFYGTLGDGNSSAILAISLSQEDGQYLVQNKLGFVGDVESSFTEPASGYEAWNGTSMATPHVSAVAALVWSSDTTRSNTDIRNALQQTALDLGPTGKDDAYGYGLVQAYNAWQFLGGEGVDNPPSVTITSPADGSSFESGATITFEGTASDTEDGDLTASLAWTSDIDGQIGTGGSFSTTLSDGNHTITVSVTDSGGNTDSDTITITVGSTISALSVGVTTDKASYTSRETVYITVTVTGGTNPVEGAAVEVTITTANGNRLTGDGTTDSNGIATFTHKVIANRDGVGTYIIDATASKDGYDSGSGSTTFEVTQ